MKKYFKPLLVRLLLLGTFYTTCYMLARSSQYHSNYVRESVGSKVVMLINEDQMHGGTGFFVKAKSNEVYLLTNAHVCGHEGQTSVFAQFGNEERLLKLRILDISKVTDLCLVEAPKFIHDGLSLGDNLYPGEEISIVGHPKLMPLTETKGQFIDYMDIRMPEHEGACEVETDIDKTVNSMFGPFCTKKMTVGSTTVLALGGNSGSPVVNYKGQVVGVLFAGDPSDNWGLILKLSDIQEFLRIY